ncbi:hypothetical protein QVD17_40513 [Tagetes erecta]|uniref:Uncharacterized protein n=1 Tax=Tagetes erecta TaxID=13708 RepID=A0AAD8JS02_TARER|nr:hypothetical protein QVD17_40513 [Tagetes erecta]
MVALFIVVHHGRAKLDNNERLADFVQKLESACVETGKMTDQGSCHLLIHGPKQLLKMDKTCFGSMEAFGGQETVALKVGIKGFYLNTQEFIDAVAQIQPLAVH